MEARDFSVNTTELDKARAHGLARLGLGVDIALHGFVRLPDLPASLLACRNSSRRPFFQDRWFTQPDTASLSARQLSALFWC